MAITVEAVHRKVQYTSTGSLGPYAFAFKVLAATDIKVSVGATEKTVTTHYTTTYNSDGTGSVTFTSGNAPAADALVTIESDQAIARTTDYSTGGDFTAASINDALDRLTINDQQIETELSRQIQLTSTTKRTTSGTGTSGPLIWPYEDTASNNASKVVAYDSAGTALELGPTTTAISGAATEATNAATSAAAALVSQNAAAASAATATAAASAVAVPYTFSTTTAMADPGAGVLRFNNSSLASVTAIAVDATSAASGNPDVSDFITTWDDSTSTVKGYVQIVEEGANQNFAIFTLSAVADNTGWLQLTVAHVDGSTGFDDTDDIAVHFSRTGLKGDTGATGSTGSAGGTFGIGMILGLG